MEIGGTLMPKFWGKGYMIQAFSLLIKITYKVYKVNTLIGRTQTNNYKAIKMAGKMGFITIEENAGEKVLVKRNGKANRLII